MSRLTVRGLHAEQPLRVPVNLRPAQMFNGPMSWATETMSTRLRIFTVAYVCVWAVTSSSGPPRSTDRSEAPRKLTSREPARSVARLPELLSASYRNRVRKLSPGNQNQDVQHLPGSHTVHDVATA